MFHQPYLLCTKCHAAGTERSPLGPDLAQPAEPPGEGDAADAWRERYDVHLVESLLAPSKAIRKGYEPAVLLLADGRTLTGLVTDEKSGTIVLREANPEAAPLEIPRDKIEQRATGQQSIMPAGLANQLTSRQQFLDLVAYLSEIARGGPARALELKPDASLYAAPPLPEYEQHVDHAGLIAAWDEESYERGAKIYKRVCANCHGTHDAPGSLPTSLKFAKDRFKNGSDPYSLYQTLTRGFGLMVPQVWMVPRQKYDVIHYLREAYLKDDNPTQYAAVDAAYLARLPEGNTFGPQPAAIDPWVAMDYGPSLIYTYEFPQSTAGGQQPNFAYKGIAAALDGTPGGISRASHWSVFDHDTFRVAGAWSRTRPEESFIDWNGIQFTGEHGVHPHVAGAVAFANPVGPGWANPADGSFDDPRPLGRDRRPYGPLPRPWARYLGLYHHGQRTIVSYCIGKANILEMPGVELAPDSGEAVFTRTLQIGAAPHELVCRIAPLQSAVALIGNDDAVLTCDKRFHLLRIPARDHALVVKVLVAADGAAIGAVHSQSPPPEPLEPLTHGGPPRWPQAVVTHAKVGAGDGPFAADVLEHPAGNPWAAQVRLTGLDFVDDDRAAVCSWDGDVWLVGGLSGLGDDPATSPELTWRRIASGLFQPLGLKIVEGRIFITCRDQLVVLHDLNDDGETDFYQCYNNDHQVTEHFHEFAMGLQTDEAGNFYYAKSARHALPALVPHHGTLLRVSRDGQQTEILATGFRAANGVCLNADGTFLVTDQEGHWTPKNRINWVKPGGFYGNMLGFHDVTDTSDAAMRQPLCWITNDFDRSPAELLWVPKDAWGPLSGALLNLSYGYGKIFVVLHETVDGQHQGGMCPLPLEPFPTGLVRGRFHPHQRQLYTCGMYSWAGSRTQPGGLYRVRYTGRECYLPVELHARVGELTITFAGPLDAQSVAEVSNWALKTWSLERTKNYGSQHIGEAPLSIASARLADDGRTVHLSLPDLRPTMGMEIKYSLKSSAGDPVAGAIHNTIHVLAD